MSLLIGVLVYLLMSIACVVAGVRAGLREEPRRGELLAARERMLLVLTGLLAGVLWLALAAVLVRGWSREILQKRVMALRVKIRRKRMHALPVSLPAPPAVYTVPTLVPSSPKPMAEPARSRVTANSLWPAERVGAA